MRRRIALPVILIASVLTTSASNAQDITRGEEVFNKCKACHAIGPDAKHKVGPLLTDIFERKAGRQKGFNYSRTLRDAGRKGLVWSEASLVSFLANPNKFLPKNKMAFIGIKSSDDRKDLIAFIKSHSKPKAKKKKKKKK